MYLKNVFKKDTKIPGEFLCYIFQTLPSECSVGGFSRCCTVSSDGSHVPYIVLSSTERHKETKAVSRVCAIALQHQLKSACREEHTAVGGSGWIYQKVNAASATKLHPIEYDFVSVARSNTRSTYIMLTAVPACMSIKHGTIKRTVLYLLPAAQLDPQYL